MTRTPYQKMRKRVTKDYNEGKKKLSVANKAAELGLLLSDLTLVADNNWTPDNEERLMLAQLLLDDITNLYTAVSINRLRNACRRESNND